MRWICCFLMVVSSVAAGQTSNTAEKKNVLRVGVAEPYNQSREVFEPLWERDQLARYLNREAGRKKSERAIEAIPLKGSSMDEVGGEARKQHCAVVILTTVTGTNAGVSLDSQRGLSRIPGSVGNTVSNSDLLLSYDVQRLSDPQPSSRGSVVVHGTNYQGQPAEDWNDAVRQAMDEAAPLILKQLRGFRAPDGD